MTRAPITSPSASSSRPVSEASAVTARDAAPLELGTDDLPEADEPPRVPPPAFVRTPALPRARASASRPAPRREDAPPVDLGEALFGDGSVDGHAEGARPLAADLVTQTLSVASTPETDVVARAYQLDRQGRPEAAAGLLEDRLDDLSGVEGHLALAYLYADRLGDRGKARATLEAAVRRAPADAGARQALAALGPAPRARSRSVLRLGFGRNP